MITLNHIEIYRKYNQDGDIFMRCANEEEKIILDYTHWSLIDGLIQDLYLINQGLVADTFIKLTDEKLRISCDGELTQRVLKDYALLI